MKIQLDYDKKVITVTDKVNLGEFLSKIKDIVPGYAKWELDTNTSINWSNPIVIDRGWYKEPYTPWWESPFRYGTCTTTEYKLSSGTSTSLQGVYNLEI